MDKGERYSDSYVLYLWRPAFVSKSWLKLLMGNLGIWEFLIRPTCVPHEFHLHPPSFNMDNLMMYHNAFLSCKLVIGTWCLCIWIVNLDGIDPNLYLDLWLCLRIHIKRVEELCMIAVVGCCWSIELLIRSLSLLEPSMISLWSSTMIASFVRSSLLEENLQHCLHPLDCLRSI